MSSQKCSKCNKEQPIELFKVKKNGNLTKTCNDCRKHNSYNNKKYRCKHGEYKYQCLECKGSTICKHGRQRAFCKKCQFESYLFNVVSKRMCPFIKTSRKVEVLKHLGCGIKEFKQYIEKQLSDDWNWNNYSEIWEFDHIIPINYNCPTHKEIIRRLHYRNIQPLSVHMNRVKGNRYSEG